ncbi:MAG: pseudouridine synthase [Burkholderiales bacterium]
MVSLVVKETREDKLLDALREAYPGFSKKAMARAFKHGLVTLNGERAKCGDKVKKGDEIRVFVTGDVAGLELKPEIIYQDENFIIADKPAGLKCVSDDGEPSVLAMVEEHMKKRGEYSLDALLVPYMVYHLEKYVSGLVVLAKHEGAYLFMTQALAQRRFSRFYVCSVVGQAKENEELLAYHHQHNSRVRILGSRSKDAKPIVTRYSLLSSGTEMSLICARPLTNSLHQVRAHLAFAGLPVVGDDIYGNRKFNKKHGADYAAVWLKTIIFETGSNHEYGYLNGRRFESRTCSFPKCVYDDGLLKHT